MGVSSFLLCAVALLNLSTAEADDRPTAAEEEDELPVPTLDIERLPPNTSYEIAVQFGYGEVTYWREYVPSWINFGLRGGWGKNFGKNRLGVDFTFVTEGPMGVHTTLGLEPALAWNYVGNNGLLVGAGVGPAFLYHTRSDILGGEHAFGIAPSAAVRMGWSQTWTRVGRRVFLFVEPKLRVIDDHLNPVVVVAVGSGQGH